MSSKQLVLDWQLNEASLRKELLKLSKLQLIKLCKKKKVSSNNSKKHMVDELIKKSNTPQTPKRKSKWVKLSNPLKNKNNSQYINNPIFTNNNEIIIVIHDDSDYISSIVKYDEIKDKYTTIMQFNDDHPTKLKCKPNSIAIDPLTNHIYTLCEEGICKINIITKTIDIINSEYNDCFRFNPTSIIVDDVLHVFGVVAPGAFVEGYTVHRTIDIKTGVKSCGSAFWSGWDCALEGHGMILIKSKKKLLFIGGENGNNIMIYDLKHDRGRWSKMEDFQGWNFEFATEFFWNPGVVITRDERYVIVFQSSFEYGGYDEYREDSEERDNDVDVDPKIEIIDFEKKRLTESTIKLPFGDNKSIYAFLTDNIDFGLIDVLICGYFRKCCKDQDKELSLDLIGIMTRFCNFEHVHIIQRGTGKHWKIALGELLP